MKRLNWIQRKLQAFREWEASLTDFDLFLLLFLSGVFCLFLQSYFQDVMQVAP